jgi:alpha-glucosidase (family GH31 glycosyl hydrolase)
LEVVQRYNLFHGGGALPPLWGLGFWHRVHATFNADQVKEELQDFEERNFPIDVVGLEPGWMTKSYPCTFEWQKKRFPDPAGFTSELLDKGIRLNLWENPYISKSSRLYESMYPLSGSHLVWLGWCLTIPFPRPGAC